MDDPLISLGIDSDSTKIINELVKDNDDYRKKIPEEIGVLPIQKVTLFPFQIMPLLVINVRSIKLIDECLMGSRFFCVLSQKEETDEYGIENLYRFGTVCKVLKMLKLPNNSMRVLIQGVARAAVKEFTALEPYIKARIEVKDDVVQNDVEMNALKRNLVSNFQKIALNIPQIGEELQILAMNIEDPSKLADMVATNVNMGIPERQELLELLNVKERLKRLLALMNREIEVMEVSSKIESKMKSDVDKKQREYFLRQEMDAIRKELGEGDEVTAEINELRDRIKKAKMPEKVEKIALKELDRMAKMQPGFAEFSVARTYVEWLIDLPWSVETDDSLDLKKVQSVLNDDHYDLEKVKERIIEYLAIRKIKTDTKGQILCFVGPPGVGKTSLGQSIARAMGRKFVRISLGGIRDEAEIRGHRRTYVGSLPGRILLGMKNAGSRNPVFMLDEIDKVGADFRGDPASALLEVLDPQQNNSFIDHYLDVPFDLSRVFFITTANILDTIPAALLDRMEVLRIPGYTLEDKINIASKYLIPRQLEENGIKDKKIELNSSAIRTIIRDYTREAGVRNLEREIGNVFRKITRMIVEEKKYPQRITGRGIPRFLGAKRFFSDVAERLIAPGIATGMAWTQVGGSILFIESSKMSGKGNFKLTGSLGDVMKESANIALSLLHSNSGKYRIADRVFDRNDFHIHIPEGATPKDGPSAGITLFTSLYSLLTNRVVKSDFAMTGEITLRGKVLPIGGVKEKVLAAKEAGIRNIILPKNNQKDLEEIPDNVKRYLKFFFIDTVDDAIRLLFARASGERQARAVRK